MHTARVKADGGRMLGGGGGGGAEDWDGGEGGWLGAGAGIDLTAIRQEEVAVEAG